MRIGLAHVRDLISSQAGSSGPTASISELGAEIIPLMNRLPEGDLSVDVLRALCEAEGLALREVVFYPGWFGFVRDVNVGISLYYVVEGGRLQRLSRRYRRQRAPGRRVLGRLENLMRGRLATRSSGPQSRIERAPIPSPADAFIHEVANDPMDQRIAFMRYLGRVLSIWLDCGHQPGGFPNLAHKRRPENVQVPAVRVAGSIGAAADIAIPHTQIVSAWSPNHLTTQRSASE